MKTKTYLPVFTGFYCNNLYEPNFENEIDYINEIRENKKLKLIDYDNLDFNYNDYENEISKQLCNILENELSNFVNKIDFKNVDSPKYYNYSNDMIICNISPKKRNILKYLKDNKENFIEYLKNTYTSYDGFISNYSNDINEYCNKNFLDHKHKLGSVLNFICINEGITELDLYYDSLDIHCISEYINNYESLIN